MQTTDPDENYAREVMQLFTIGLWQLNDDGSQKLDGNGNPIPTYSNTDVKGLAAVFTGWSWNIPGDSTDNAWSNCCVYVGPGYGEELLPMQSFPSHHSTVEKDFLGVTIPASGSADPAGDLKIALDTLFNHPNVPAFFSKQLIQHLVTSNPSPAYKPEPGLHQSRCAGLQRRWHRRARQYAGRHHGCPHGSRSARYRHRHVQPAIRQSA
ncbi:MAG: DUF1800 family protein [Terracidiphilus sp.]